MKTLSNIAKIIFNQSQGDEEEKREKLFLEANDFFLHIFLKQLD